MVYQIYNLAVLMAAPFGAAYLAARPKLRPLLGRFAPSIPKFEHRPFWVQACSVGEVAVAKQIISQLHQRWPETPTLLTVSTISGLEFAKSSNPNEPVTWFPFDEQHVARKFIRTLNPRALILVETEIWPNILREARRAAVPTLLTNGRLSDKRQTSYKRYSSLLRPIVSQISRAGMQNQEYAERLIDMGASPENVHVTGNTKFDGVRISVEANKLEKLRAETGISADAPTLIFGSTRPGDETLAASCWNELKNEFPDLRIIVAPRHIERLSDAMAPFTDPILQRSRNSFGQSPSGERVFFLDTVGELGVFYALGTIAIVGGSFYPGVDGHNPIEPAALGAPTVFGPYMRNFVEPAKELVQCGGAVQVEKPEELCETLRSLLRDSRKRESISVKGREAVLANQGATARTLDILAELLGDS
jgi:3-deoxy-D-manno-octulosonic-acid transferase